MNYTTHFYSCGYKLPAE